MTEPATAAQIAYVMRLVEMGQLRIGPGNRINKQAVMQLLDLDRPETFDCEDVARWHQPDSANGT